MQLSLGLVLAWSRCHFCSCYWFLFLIKQVMCWLLGDYCVHVPRCFWFAQISERPEKSQSIRAKTSIRGRPLQRKANQNHFHLQLHNESHYGTELPIIKKLSRLLAKALVSVSAKQTDGRGGWSWFYRSFVKCWIAFIHLEPCCMIAWKSELIHGISFVA